MKGSRYSEGQIQSLIAEQVASGKSVQTFSHAKGIKPVTFYFWKRKFGHIRKCKRVAVAENSRFLPVRLSSQQQQFFKTKNEIGKGVRLKIGKCVLVFGSQCSSTFVVEVLRGVL